MKLYGYRKYILVLIFLLMGFIVYLRSDRWDKDDKFYGYLLPLAGIAIIGSVGSKFANKINKDEP